MTLINRFHIWVLSLSLTFLIHNKQTQWCDFSLWDKGPRPVTVLIISVSQSWREGVRENHEGGYRLMSGVGIDQMDWFQGFGEGWKRPKRLRVTDVLYLGLGVGSWSKTKERGHTWYRRRRKRTNTDKESTRQYKTTSRHKIIQQHTSRGNTQEQGQPHCKENQGRTRKDTTHSYTDGIRRHTLPRTRQ